MALGRRIGERLRPGDCLRLSGDLGAGKTTLTKGLVAGAGGDDDVRSPTFLLHQVHPGRVTLHHLDLYRLPSGTDLSSLGLEEFLVEGAAVVEWGERAQPGFFNGTIELAVQGESSREIRLTLPSHLGEALGG
jgi:tRNA threonylcarbamoyl adenosine modification protein YjeE